jgi:hypothetical protein
MINDKLPILYIDVDGVLFGRYGGHIQLRPNAIAFLIWAVDHFECRWLTCWNKKRVEQLLDALYARHLIDKIEYIDWNGVGVISSNRTCHMTNEGKLVIFENLDEVKEDLLKVDKVLEKENWDKVDAIDLDEDFYWIEDGIGERAEKLLKNAGKSDRYIATKFEGEDGLKEGWVQLDYLISKRTQVEKADV